MYNNIPPRFTLFSILAPVQHDPSFVYLEQTKNKRSNFQYVGIIIKKESEGDLNIFQKPLNHLKLVESLTIYLLIGSMVRRFNQIQKAVQKNLYVPCTWEI